MTAEMPAVPAGNGQHPILMIAISADKLAASADFYARIFGWPMQSVSPEVTAAVVPAGPSVSLRSGTPEGFPGVVPFIGVPGVEAALARVVAAGGAVEREIWRVPAVGNLARFRDPSGTIYGLMEGMASTLPSVPMPFGSNPRPPVHSVCSLEMYGADGNATAAFFGEHFGWGAQATMPRYMAFDPGAGIGGVFQSHTPALPAIAYIYVADVDATLAAIDAAGGKRMGEPMRMPGMACFGYFSDPSGTSMGLIGP